MIPDPRQSPDPKDQESDEDSLICHCMLVEKNRILQAIAGGAHTLEAIQDATYASTGCGTCRYDVQNLLRQCGHLDTGDQNV